MLSLISGKWSRPENRVVSPCMTTLVHMCRLHSKGSYLLAVSFAFEQGSWDELHRSRNLLVMTNHFVKTGPSMKFSHKAMHRRMLTYGLVRFVVIPTTFHSSLRGPLHRDEFHFSQTSNCSFLLTIMWASLSTERIRSGKFQRRLTPSIINTKRSSSKVEASLPVSRFTDRKEIDI